MLGDEKTKHTGQVEQDASETPIAICLRLSPPYVADALGTGAQEGVHHGWSHPTKAHQPGEEGECVPDTVTALEQVAG